MQRSVDRPDYVVIDLDFDTCEGARSFLRFLEEQVWASPESSPALIGTPQTTILEPFAP